MKYFCRHTFSLFSQSIAMLPKAVLLLSVSFLGSLAASAQVSVSPSSLTWSKVAVGNAGGQKVATLTNAGSSAVTISSIAFTGTGAPDFTIFQKTCGATLAASSSCTVTVLFKPKAAGTFTAGLAFTDNASGSPQTVALSGLGTSAGSVGASPSSLAFGSITAGTTSASQVVTVANTTSSAVTLGAGGISGSGTSAFAITSSTCGSSLAASASCTATIVFTPANAAAYSAAWSILSGSSPLSVGLSGTGVAPAGTATISPTSLSWSKVAVGNAGGPKVATLTNAGTASISISSIAFTGANPGDFKVYQNACSSSLAATASCTVTVLFKPTAGGTRTATLAVTDTASNSPQQVALSGLGTSTGSVAASPGNLLFGNINDGSSSALQAIIVSNTTPFAVTLSAAGISGSNAGDFSIAASTCGSSLAASASCTLSVVFTPTAVAPETAVLSLTSSNSPTALAVNLSGTGTSAGSVTASPLSLVYGSIVDATTSISQTITVSNTTANAVTLSSAGISGANPSDFAVTSTTCGSSLAASASCAVTVAFTPSLVAPESASWSITDSNSATPLTVALSGTGSNGTTISPSTVTLSEGATQQFSADPTSSWASTCGSVSSTGLYTAPLVPGSCTVTATPSVGNGSSATVTVNSPITLTPAAVNLHALNTQQFTVGSAVTWSSSCGSISTSGLFTAPASAGPCTITATASTGTPYTTVATAAVDVVNYTAWKGGGGNTGAQTDELLLTPSNVNSSSFGKLWQAAVDGWVNAQPLYMNGIVINGSPHNAVFTVTSNDSVYAFDGDTGALLWQTSLIPAGATAVPSSAVGFTSGPPQIGILSTPVIDPSTNTLYVVSETSEQNATYFPHRLHALDATTGQEKFGGPVLISNPQMAPLHKMQRAGLLLANGNVYVGIGSMQDRDPYNGMLFAFNASTLAQVSVFVVTPSGNEGGVWMGGAAPAVDENGNVYISTGNGTYDGATNYGQSAIKFSPNLQLLDYFTPFNFDALNLNDLDLGSGDVMIVPDQAGPYPHELIVCGKPTPVYVLNGDNMGREGASSDNIIQRLDTEVGILGVNSHILVACMTSPAMWGQNVYFGGKWDFLKMFTLNPATGLLSSSPTSQGTFTYGYPGAVPVVSSNGASNGIVWTIDTGANTLVANDATNLGSQLYSGAITGGALIWTVPTPVNGHVYAGGKGVLFAFGLTH